MRVENLFRQLKREYFKTKVLQSSLDTLILALTANLLLFLSGINYEHIWIGIGALAFFIADSVYRVKGYSVEVFENSNEELNEVLRTAKDNLDRRDRVSEALFDEVMDRARKVPSDSIMASDRVVQKLIAVGGLSILTAVSGIIVPSVDTDFEFAEISDFVDTVEEEIRADGDAVLGESTDLGSGSDIDIEIEGEGESFEDGVASGFEGDSELMYDAPEDDLDEDRELMRRYSLELQNIQ